MNDPRDAGYALAYEVGVQAITQQAETMRETRDRAGSLMSAAAVAGGLAAGFAFNADHAAAIGLPGTIGGVLAVAGFMGVAVSAVLIWSPNDVVVVQDGGVIINAYIEGDPPLELSQIHRELALWMGNDADENREALAVQSRTFTVGLTALLVQIVGIVIAIGDVAYG